MGSEDTLIFSALLAPLTEPHDVVTRHLNVMVDGNESVHLTTTAADNKFDDFAVPEGSNVELVFADEDDAGNLSEALRYSFVAVDQIPPGVPGGLSVVPVSEEPGTEYTG